MYRSGLLILLIFTLSCVTAEPIDFESERWEIAAQESEVLEYLGKKALRLKGGKALLNDANFEDGVISFEVAFSAQRGFSGGIWRVADLYNFEEFYMRPHQSGNPDANQYTPVFNGSSGWQLYHGPAYATPIEYDFDQWFPVKIVVSGNQAEVYVSDMDKPLLFIPELKREKIAGGVGVSASNFSPAYFSNFRYEKKSAPALKGSAPEEKKTPENTVTAWDVSSTFDRSLLREKHLLTDAEKSSLQWQTLSAEKSGLANLARVAKKGEKDNTVFTRLLIDSDREQTKQLSLGYSDIAWVYLNDRLLYAGNNFYRTRDYRYLGTIGYFDAVFLPLQEGRNELWIAVSENFGGWGVQAAFGDMEGITVATGK